MLMYSRNQASLVAQTVKNLSAVQETWVQSMGQKDSLEKEITTYSSIPAWGIPWTAEPEGLQSVGSQRVEHDCGTKHTYTSIIQGPPWWLSGSESACQCRRHRCDSWSLKIPHATEQLILWVLEPPSHNSGSPRSLEPMLHDKRSPQNENPEPCN